MKYPFVPHPIPPHGKPNFSLCQGSDSPVSESPVPCLPESVLFQISKKNKSNWQICWMWRNVFQMFSMQGQANYKQHVETNFKNQGPWPTGWPACTAASSPQSGSSAGSLAAPRRQARPPAQQSLSLTLVLYRPEMKKHNLPWTNAPMYFECRWPIILHFFATFWTENVKSILMKGKGSQ